MAAAVGQHTHVQGTSAATSVTTPTISTAATGSTFVVAQANSGVAEANFPIDSNSNVYTQIRTTLGDGANYEASWYYKENGTGGSGHTATGKTTAAKIITVYFVEIIGGETSGIKDQDVAGIRDTATPFTTNTTGTTSQNDEVALAFYTTETTLAGPEVLTWGNGFAQIDADGDGNFVTAGIGSKVLSATGTVQASVTSASGGTSAMVGFLATFKASAVAVISVQPADQIAAVGATAVFSVTASNATTYQWQDDRTGVFTNVSGGSGDTTASYTTATVTQDMSRSYRCVINSGTFSNSARLYIGHPLAWAH